MTRLRRSAANIIQDLLVIQHLSAVWIRIIMSQLGHLTHLTHLSLIRVTTAIPLAVTIIVNVREDVFSATTPIIWQIPARRDRASTHTTQRGLATRHQPVLQLQDLAQPILVLLLRLLLLLYLFLLLLLSRHLLRLRHHLVLLRLTDQQSWQIYMTRSIGPYQNKYFRLIIIVLLW